MPFEALQTNYKVMHPSSGRKYVRILPKTALTCPYTASVALPHENTVYGFVTSSNYRPSILTLNPMSSNEKIKLSKRFAARKYRKEKRDLLQRLESDLCSLEKSNTWLKTQLGVEEESEDDFIFDKENSCVEDLKKMSMPKGTQASSSKDRNRMYRVAEKRKRESAIEWIEIRLLELKKENEMLEGKLQTARNSK